MLLSLLLLPFASNTLDLSAEQALQKKVSLSLKGVTLTEATKALTGVVGSPVEAVTPLWDLKVTMFCKDESASSMMEGLARVTGAEWDKDGDVYRLRVESVDHQNREAYEQAELRLMRDRIEKGLMAYRRLAPANSRPADTSKLTAAERAAHDALMKDTRAVALGAMLASFNSAQWNAFWRGEARTWAPMVGGSPTQAAMPDESLRVIARYDPFLCSFESTLGSTDPRMSASSSFTPRTGLKADRLVWFQKPPAGLAEMPFAKKVLEWENGSVQPEDERLKRGVATIRWQKMGHFVPMPTLSDQLEAFYRGTGFPVVADAFSSPLQMNASDGRSIAADLAAQGFFRRFDDGVLQVRHPGFWRLRQAEIPAPVIASAAKLAEEEPMTMLQYASLAARLTPEQASALTIPAAVALPFDTEPFVKMIPAFAFYNQLSPPQRAQSGAGLSAAEFTAPQSRAFVNSLLLGVLRGYGTASYLGRATAGDMAELGVLTAEESFESGKKKKNGKAHVASRKFRIYVGSRAQFVRFEADAKGPDIKTEK